MKILIVSDTHGSDDAFDEVIFRETPFDLLIHCGDVDGREDYIEAVIDCPKYIVAGNNDFFSDLPGEEQFSVGRHKVFLTHGHYYGVTWGLGKVVGRAMDQNCDVVMFGHSHVPVIEKVEEVLCMNPGSLTFPRQRGRRPSYIVLTVDDRGELYPEIRYL